MDTLRRSLAHATMLSKRDFQSDTWLIMGITAIIFAVLASLGIWVLCYRRRGHKRRMDRRRTMAAKARGDYKELDQEKEDSEEVEVPLKNRPSNTTSSNETNSPRITSPPSVESRSQTQAQVQTQTRLSRTSSSPIQHDRSRDPSSSPSPQPQLGVTDIPLYHPQPQGVYLPPPVVSNDRGRYLSSPEHNPDYDYDYDGRTGYRIDRSPSPARLVLSRSISMLRPREQQE